MNGTGDASDDRETLAAAFDRDLDPLSTYAETFENLAVDPFDLFETEALANRDITDRTRQGYRIVFSQWQTHMAQEGRHPACPNEAHVRSFIQYLLEKIGNEPATVKEKLRKLSDCYRYWQTDQSFPHPQDFNPFEVVRKTTSLTTTKPKEPPNIPFDDLRRIIHSVRDIRDQAIITIQLKLGLRATEVCNLQLAELDIQNEELTRHYPELGTHPVLKGRPNAFYVPHDRAGNKSRRPRMLPLDAELREVLIRYLTIRPTTGDPWVFLSKPTHSKLNKKAVNKVWKNAFHPEYAETDTHRAVTSHYGRHRFTSYWTVTEGVSQELVKYMRGDTPGPATIEEMGAINHYIHTYYEDIEELYREGMFGLFDSV